MIHFLNNNKKRGIPILPLKVQNTQVCISEWMNWHIKYGSIFVCVNVCMCACACTHGKVKIYMHTHVVTGGQHLASPSASLHLMF